MGTEQQPTSFDVEVFDRVVVEQFVSVYKEARDRKLDPRDLLLDRRIAAQAQGDEAACKLIDRTFALVRRDTGLTAVRFERAAEVGPEL